VAQVDAVFTALADPTRRHLLETLARRDRASATGLAGELPISRQAVAKHLAALRDAELVRADRVGRETLYSLHPEPLDAATKWISTVGAEWDGRLAKLKRALG
jgi:DNA-binding transcriptional ArsR family regulator